MAIILEAAYSKKLGLPNYSSHSYVVSIRTELSDLTQVEEESARLYALLQQSVDQEIQAVGFLPDGTTYGMNHVANGNGHDEPHQATPTVHPQPTTDHWTCSDKQKELILSLVDQHHLDKNDVEAMAKEMFGLPVKPLTGCKPAASSKNSSNATASAPTATANPKPTAAKATSAARPPTAPMSMLVDTLQPPPMEDQIIQRLQQKVSPSKLSLFQSCRLKFFFRYVLGLKKPKAAALQVGASVHATLKAWNRARWREEIPAWNLLYPVYSAAWIAGQHDEPVAWENTSQEEEQKQIGWRLLETFFRESPIRDAGKPDAVEVSVEADLSSHGLPTLVGVLDLVQNETIIDFKTSGTTPNADRAALVNGTQATAYSILYRENTGRKEMGVELHHLVKLKQPKLVVIPLPPVGEREQNRLLRVIESYVAGLERRDFIPSPGLQCAACEFFHECAAWH